MIVSKQEIFRHFQEFQDNSTLACCMSLQSFTHLFYTGKFATAVTVRHRTEYLEQTQTSSEQVSVSSGAGRTEGPKFEMPLKW